MIKSRILVVDDEPVHSGLIRQLLEQTMRFEVRVENRSARALCASREFCPDMVLLDVDMPGKDGGEVAREIRAEPALRQVPILMVTSLLSPEETAGSAKIVNGLRFMAKPVQAKILIDAVDQALAGALAGRFASAGDTLAGGCRPAVKNETENL